MPPRRSFRRSSRVAWTTATPCCSASATLRRTKSDYFVACSRCRMLPPAWSQAPVGVTTSHQCYGSCIGCQSVSASSSRSRGSYISRLSVWLTRTSQITVAFCRTLAVAHCGPIPKACGSCLCHEHTTNAVIGSFSAAGPQLWNDYSPAAGTYLRLLQTISENSFIWRPKRILFWIYRHYRNKLIYLSNTQFPHMPIPQWNLDRFSHVSTAHSFNQQTDRQTLKQ